MPKPNDAARELVHHDEHDLAMPRIVLDFGLPAKRRSRPALAPSAARTESSELYFDDGKQLFVVSVQTQPSFSNGNPTPLPITGFVQTARRPVRPYSWILSKVSSAHWNPPLPSFAWRDKTPISF